MDPKYSRVRDEALGLCREALSKNESLAVLLKEKFAEDAKKEIEDARQAEAEAQPLTPAQQKFAAADGFEDAHDIVLGRCSMCHAREPVWEGILWAPKGVLLETRADIAGNAKQIYLLYLLTAQVQCHLMKFFLA